MTVPLFDVQCGFGGATRGSAERVGAKELAREMARLRIDRALVRIAPEELDADIAASNAALYAACAAQPSLVPCPVVVPADGGDFPPEDRQVDAHIRRGAGAVCVRPGNDYWSLAPWGCDRLFRALEERRMPVVCLHRLLTLEQVGGLAGRYPALPLILAEATYRQQRSILAMMGRFPNIHLSLGNNYTVHKGIEQLISRVGAERILFGTGFPFAEPMTAITQLMYAEIADEQKRRIGCGNAERLLGGIAR